MTEPSDHVPSAGTETHPYQAGGGHGGLVFGASILVSIGTILAGVYAVRSGSLIFKAFALDGALVALAAWLSLDACRIRRRFVEAHEWQPKESQGWHDLEAEDVNVTLQDVHHARKFHLAVLALPATALAGFLAIFLLWTRSGGEAGLLPASDTAAASGICPAACCPWVGLSGAVEATGQDELGEAPALILALDRKST